MSLESIHSVKLFAWPLRWDSILSVGIRLRRIHVYCKTMLCQPPVCSCGPVADRSRHISSVISETNVKLNQPQLEQGRPQIGQPRLIHVDIQTHVVAITMKSSVALSTERLDIHVGLVSEHQRKMTHATGCRQNTCSKHSRYS